MLLSCFTHTRTHLLDTDSFFQPNGFQVREIRNHSNSYNDLWKLPVHGVSPPPPCSILNWLDYTGHFNVWTDPTHAPKKNKIYGSGELLLVVLWFTASSNITLSPAQERGFGLAVIPLDSLNLGKAFNRQGYFFPLSEDMLHLLYSKGKNKLPLSLLILTAVLWAVRYFFPFIFFPWWGLKTGFFMWKPFCKNAEAFCLPICNFSTADSSSVPVRNAV